MTTLSLDGYQISECIHSSRVSQVFAGVRTRDGLQVALKVYRGGSPSQGARRRAEHEFALLERLECDGVVRPVALTTVDDRLVLVVERFPGMPLSDYIARQMLGISEFLAIAEQITTSLAGIHAARIVHKDIKPANVLIDPQSLRTCIIDFGIAAEFGRAQPHEGAKRAEGTLQSMAPEQTGRIGLGIDFRTDLYSLGATLYHVLTGADVFDDTGDALALIQAHVTTVPKAPSERRADVPEPISRLIMKLLQKDPERRYQTAWGLRADLIELRRQWDEHGVIAKDFELGAHDASDRLRFPSMLFGREVEADALRAALQRVAAGRAELVLIAGPAGIGKSALASVLRRELASSKGYLAHAKFDANRRGQPYVGFASVLASLLDQILAESSDRLEQWAIRLRARLGTVGRALTVLVPSLEFVVQDFAPVPPLEPKEAQDRLALAVVRFIEVFTEQNRPLVLFFDDLQWADAGSRFLIEALMLRADQRSLLIAATHRPGEKTGGALRTWLERLDALPIPMQTLELGALRFEQTNAMLAEILRRDSADTAVLATCIGMKTQHNPLLIRRMLEYVWERGLIRYVHGKGWTWDQNEVAEIEIGDDVAHILASKIDVLASEQARVLRIASVLGAVLDVELLGAVCGEQRPELLQTLLRLTEEGLLTPCREGFRFVHDRVQEAARERVPANEQAQIHHQAAQALEALTPTESLDARLFEIVDHLNFALALMQPAGRLRTLELNMRAGARALAEGASVNAAQYLATARALLEEADWSVHSKLVISLYQASAEAAYQAEEFDLALELLDTLEQRPLDTLERARVAAKRIEVFHVSRSNLEAVELTIRVLRTQEVALPREPRRMRLHIERLWTDWCIRGERLLRSLEPAVDPTLGRLAFQRVVGASGGPLAYRSNRLPFLTMARLLRQYVRHGRLSPPAALIVAYGLHRLAILKSPRDIERFRRVALEWIERVPGSPLNVHAKQMIHAWIDPWLGPRRSAIDALADLYEELRETGQLGHSSSCLHVRACHLALVGEPLPQVRAAFQKLGLVADRNVAMSFAKEVPSLRMLSRETEAGLDIEAALVQLDTHLRTAPAIHVHEGVRWVGSLCFMASWTRALVLAQAIEPWVRDVIAMSTHLVDYEFFRGLAAAVTCRRRAWRVFALRAPKILRRSGRRVAAWAAHNPEFLHMSLGLEAERLRLSGRGEQALALYDQAANRAHEHGYVHHAALLRERRAEQLRSLHRIELAERELQRALELYALWGADAKVEQLHRRTTVSS